MPQCELSEEARPMTIQAMSADSHLDLVYLPKDAFLSRMDPAWGDRIPRVVA